MSVVGVGRVVLRRRVAPTLLGRIWTAVTKVRRAGATTISSLIVCVVTVMGRGIAGLGHHFRMLSRLMSVQPH